MSSKFKVIDGSNGELPEAPPNEGLVALLEEVLAMARAGKLQSTFIVSQTADNSVMAGWANPPPRYTNQFELLGGIENAKLDYMLTEIERRG